MATKSKPYFVSKVTFSEAKNHESKSGLPSMTVPNDALTVKEIVIKYAQGLLPPDLTKQTVFDPNPSFDSVDLEKMATMDIYDRELFSIDLQRQITDAKNRLEIFNANQAKLKADKEREEIEDKLLLRKLRRTGKETPRKAANAGGSNGGSEADDDSND